MPLIQPPNIPGAVGPAGPTGATGPQGPQGDTGPAGADGTTPAKATGTEVNTGTDDTKYVTPKSIADSNIVFTPDLSAYQPVDSDLTAIAALTTTSFGRALLELANAGALRTAAGLGTLATQDGTFSGSSSGTNTGDQTNITGNAGTVTNGVYTTDTGTVTNTMLANDSVTYAKLQNVTDARILGRNAGSSGDCQEITIGAGLSLSGGSLSATGTSSSSFDFGLSVMISRGLY